MKEAYIAVDFGGGSGRVIAASIDRGQLTLEELHRFDNRQIAMGGHLYWDFLALFQEMKSGLRKAVEAGYRIRSIGIDTWGVDFGLIDRDGNLLGNPLCYRDPAFAGGAGHYFEHNDVAAHYAEAGIQIMDINTLYRLVDMKRTMPAMLAAADRLLFTPDLFSFFLTGVATNEYTIASTSELIDAGTGTWNTELIRRAGLPEHIFGRIVMPGEVRGSLTDDVKREIGIDYDVKVIAVGSHDTASAVYAVPGTYGVDGTAFLSSGTWSLLGVVIDAPITTEKARLAGFTNEGAVGGKIKFLQNITGLWILQRLIAAWKGRGLPAGYDYLLSEAGHADISTIVDVDDSVFTNPENMEDAIRDYCLSRGLTAPATQGEFVRCVLMSLAARYKRGIEELNSMLPAPVSRLQIIGGGSRNALLNRLTEEAIGIPVTAGPVEATAIGNVLLQAVADGVISSASDIDGIINK